MSFCCEIALRAPEALSGAVDAWCLGPLAKLGDLAGLATLDLYRPAPGEARDPFNADGPGPLALAMLDFGSAEALGAAMAGPRIAGALAALPPGASATATALERRFYPLAGEAEPAPLTAPFSYVVRYHRPARDEAAFVANYVASHPPTQAHLPGIRAIACYFPLDALQSPGLTSADYFVGNEVVFDDMAAFNLAMASPARHELRAHFHAFPPFSGANTHYPMLRTRLVG